jgi:hypothetical protein
MSTPQAIVSIGDEEVLTTDQLKLVAQIREKLVPMLHRRAECFRGTIVPALAKHGVHFRGWHDLTTVQKLEAASRGHSWECAQAL